MGEKCQVCGKDFVIGETFYHLVQVRMDDSGFIRETVDEYDMMYICADCANGY